MNPSPNFSYLNLFVFFLLQIVHSHKAWFVSCCWKFMPLRKRWCFLLGRRQQHFGCLAVEEKKTLALCSPPQMDSLHQRKTMFLKCILLLHSPSPLQKGYMNTNYSRLFKIYTVLFSQWFVLPFPHRLIAGLFRYFCLSLQGVSWTLIDLSRKAFPVRSQT